MAKRAAPPRQVDPRALHGLLPLVADPDTGTVRFARNGEDALPPATVADLPQARLELVAFESEGALKAWHAAVVEFGGNHVGVDVPAIARPQFALLSRFDMDPHPGTTVPEMIPLRFPGGRVDAERLEDATRSAKANADRTHRETAAVRAVERDWAPELAALRRLPSVDVYVSGRDDAFTVVTKDTDRSASWSPRKTGDGRYVASMSAIMMMTNPRHMDRDLLALLDGRMGGAGVMRDDLTFSVAVERLDADGVALLGERENLVHATLREIDHVTSLRGVVAALKEDHDLLSVLRDAAAGMPVVLCPWHGTTGAQVSPRRGLRDVGQFVHRRGVEKGCLEAVWSRTHEKGTDVALGITDFGRRLLTDSVADLAATWDSRPETRGYDAATVEGRPLAEAVDAWDEATLDRVAERVDELEAAVAGRKGAGPLAVRIAAYVVKKRLGAGDAPAPRP